MAAKKYNYITQAQLNSALAEFFTRNANQTFDQYFTYWVTQNMPTTLQPVTVLTPVQHAFVANVLTIFNNI